MLCVVVVVMLLVLLFGVVLGWLFVCIWLLGWCLLEVVCMLLLVLLLMVLGYGIFVLMGWCSVLGGWLCEYFDYSIVFNWYGVVVVLMLVVLFFVFKGVSSVFV